MRVATAPSQHGYDSANGSTIGLPFAHLNLRFNPFGELTKADRQRLAVVDLQDWAALLRRPGQALQLLADHGRGKSTHLLALHAQLKTAPYIQLHTQVTPPPFTAQPLHFVDSIENLGWWQRRRLYKLAGSIALTTHRDLSGELRRAGFQVRTAIISCLDDQQLVQLFEQRIEFARRDSGSIPVISPQALSTLRLKFGDDIRAMEHCLYTAFQHLKEPCHVTL